MMFLLFTLWTGCMFSEAHFERDLDRETCKWLADCYGEDKDACIEQAALDDGNIPESCDFKPIEGKDCILWMRNLPCPGQDSGFVFPEVCVEAYGCEAEER